MTLADPTSAQPVSDGKTKRDEIVAELRRLVAEGHLERGARIRQDEIAQRFGVSITPVREALRQLEAEGLLISEPHKGVRVASVDVEKLKGIYIARRLLEPYATQRAALRVSRRDVGEMRRVNDQMRAASAAEEDLAVREANRRLHFILYGHAGVPGLTALIENLWLAFPWDVLTILKSRVAESLDEHEAIITAVEAGDLEAVRTAMDVHIARSYLALMTHVEQRDELATDPFEFDND